MPRFWAIALVLLFVGCDIPGEPGDGYWDNEPAIFTFSFTNRLGTFAATATQTLVDSTNVSEASRKQARDTLEELQDSLKRAGRWESAEAVRRSRANAELAAEILVGLAVNARLFSAARELSMAVLESEAGSSGHCPKKTVVLGGQCRSKDFGFVLSPLCCASKDECSAGALDLGFSVVDPPR